MSDVPTRQLGGKVAVVTGGTQGLGEAIARLFAARGAAGLVICGRQSHKGEAVAADLSAKGCRTVFVRADLAGVDDARAVVDAGADAVVVSNHGGRQLDRAPVPLELLPAVVEAVGDRAEVYVDGGILDGADVAAAVALGARGCLVGRAFLCGLMAGGERGGQRMADILTKELARTMQLLGAAHVGQLAGKARLRP